MIDINNMNILALAYLGDSIYEVYVRKHLINNGIQNVNELQESSIKYVSAKGQAYYLNLLISSNKLTEEEINIVHRDRNHKSHKSPKNTDINTYKLSTGFEALIGYLYLNNKDRLNEIMKFILEDGE